MRARLLETLVAGLEPSKRFAPPGWRRPSSSETEGSAFERALSGVDETVVLLSLKTLASFELDTRACLLPLARDTVAPYLQAPSPLVRAAAARACARLLLPRGSDATKDVESSSSDEDEVIVGSPVRKGSRTPPRTPQSRPKFSPRRQATEVDEEEEEDALLQPHYYCGPSAVVVDDVLSKLLAVALADDDLAPRRSVVKALRSDPRFDGHLARAKHVDSLALLLHDEDCALQLDALALLGRLAARNPGAALAVVRNALARALDALRCSGSDPVSRERAARLAAGALRAESPRARKAVWPLAAAVVAALPLGYRPLDAPIVESEARVPTRLACAALDALGECVLVLGPRARDVVYAPKVLAPLFDALLDRSSTRKRELALRVLGRLAAHAGCVVAPYLEHAPLLPRVLAVVCENSAARATREDDKPLATQHATWSLCREALRTLGLLGALDPYAFDVVQRSGRDARTRARKRALTNDLLAPHLAALLDEDPSEPAAAAMYAQSCAVALPAVRDTPEVKQRTDEDAYYSTTTLTKSTINNDEEFGPSLKHTRRRRRDGSSRKLKDAEKPTPQQGQEYYARCAVDALVRVLRDPSLASHHATTTQALTQVVKALGHRCVPFLGALVPHLLDVARDGEPGLRESVLQQLASLASTARYHLRDYVPRILDW